MSRLSLGPIKSPIQWEQGILYREAKWPGCETDPSNAKVKNVRSYTWTPPYAFMAVTGTTLPLPLILLSSYAILWRHGVVWVKNSFWIFFFQFPFLNPNILPITLFVSVLWQMLASQTMQHHKMTIIIFFHTLLTSLIVIEYYVNWINNTVLLNKPSGKYCLSCISPVCYIPSCRATCRIILPLWIKDIFPPRINSQSMELTTHLYLTLRLRMKVVLPLCPQYAFVVPFWDTRSVSL